MLALITAVILAVLALLLVARRFFLVRSSGASVVLRRLPASGNHRWRHGVIRYDGDLVHYYKLRSILPAPDATFHRTEVTLIKRRDLTPSEAAFITEDSRVVMFQSHQAQWEIALRPHAEMGLTAWLESAPDARQLRPDYRRLRQRISQVRRRRKDQA